MMSTERSVPAARPPRRGCAPKRHSDQGESEAGKGKGETLIEFDAGFAPVRAAVVPEIGDGAFGIAEGALFAGVE